MAFPPPSHPDSAASTPRRRRLRLEDLSVPMPHAQDVQRFQSAYQQLYGRLLDREQAADFLFRLLIVTRYRQLTSLKQRQD